MSTPEAQTFPPEDILQSKGGNRIQVNNILSAICLAALSVLLGQPEQQTLSPWTVGQLAVAIPLLVTSSLAYAKMCYRTGPEWIVWDTLGWFTHTLGYLTILNATFILLYNKGYQSAAWVFLGLTVGTFVLYSVLDAMAKRSRTFEKAWKLIFYLVGLFIGSVLPILARWA